MTLEDLGYTQDLEQYRQDNGLEDFGVGRVISEHKDRYEVKTSTHEFDAELIGNLRFTAESRYDFPAVGDWVAISEYEENKALIHHVYPRHSTLERQAVGKSAQVQIIATNVDFGLIVQSVNRDFNINRLERYLTICHTSKVAPIIILSKIDLIEEAELQTLLTQIKQRIKDVPVVALSNQSQTGLNQIKELIIKGKTYCLLGSSGVGKSTLINNLTGAAVMETGIISESVDRGKHVTSHRELIVMDGGGILIDNPGMREVGITSTSEGLEATFDEILQLASDCRFKDCTHTNEKGCAILAAVESGEIDADSYTNFRKMERERSHFETSVEDRKKKEKTFGKMIKQINKQRRDSKY